MKGTVVLLNCSQFIIDNGIFFSLVVALQSILDKLKGLAQRFMEHFAPSCKYAHMCTCSAWMQIRSVPQRKNQPRNTRGSAVWMFLIRPEAHARRTPPGTCCSAPVALRSAAQLSGCRLISLTFNQDGRKGRAAHTPRQKQAVTEPDEDISTHSGEPECL